MMDPSFIKDWGGAVAIGISLIGTVYAWLTSRAKANSVHLEAVDDKLEDHRERIQSIESELKHLPKKDDFTELKISLATLNGELGRIGEGMKGLGRAVSRIDSYLRKDDK